MNIACDLTAFSTPEEKARHENQSSSLITGAAKIVELEDGYSIYHPYSEETFLSFAKWITVEHKCCPFFTFELVLEPRKEAYEICLRLRGSDEIKKFISLTFHGI